MYEYNHMKELAMGWERVAKCDVCGREKGTGNKWLLIESYVSKDLVNSRFTIYHWSAPLCDGVTVKFICSEECLHKRQQEFLALRSKVG